MPRRARAAVDYAAMSRGPEIPRTADFIFFNGKARKAVQAKRRPAEAPDQGNGEMTQVAKKAKLARSKSPNKLAKTADSGGEVTKNGKRATAANKGGRAPAKRSGKAAPAAKKAKQDKKIDKPRAGPAKAAAKAAEPEKRAGKQAGKETEKQALEKGVAAKDVAAKWRTRKRDHKWIGRRGARLFR